MGSGHVSETVRPTDIAAGARGTTIRLQIVSNVAAGD